MQPPKRRQIVWKIFPRFLFVRFIRGCTAVYRLGYSLRWSAIISRVLWMQISGDDFHKRMYKRYTQICTGGDQLADWPKWLEMKVFVDTESWSLPVWRWWSWYCRRSLWTAGIFRNKQQNTNCVSVPWVHLPVSSQTRDGAGCRCTITVICGIASRTLLSGEQHPRRRQG